MSYIKSYAGGIKRPSHAEILYVMRLVNAHHFPTGVTRGFWRGFYSFFGMRGPGSSRGFHCPEFRSGERVGDYSRF